MSTISWSPTPKQVTSSKIYEFMSYIGKRHGQSFDGYKELWQWSIDEKETFWDSLWDYCGCIGDKGDIILDDNNGRMMGARFFPNGELNYAENVLEKMVEGGGRSLNAMVFRDETGSERQMSRAELLDQVSRWQQAMKDAGVAQGDRVAGYMPNMMETIVAALAAISLGAVWSSASPDFGVQGVLDRFGQIKPKLLISVDGYYYNGKMIDVLEKVEQIVPRIESLEKVIIVPFAGSKHSIFECEKAISSADFTNDYIAKGIEYKRVLFNAPLFIMFSSGTSAKYIEAMKVAGLEPAKTHDVSSLRTITSTGSPLIHESYDYIYDKIKGDVHVASISGGTDIVSCFVLGNPISPVHRGEIQGAGLGLAVDVFDDSGNPVAPGGVGELVCTQPFPCMPVCFWNDEGGARYKKAYFDSIDNIWVHGDWIEKTHNGGLVILGRSDATLNPGGVRIGTSEIYRQVEKIDAIKDSVVIGQSWDGDVRVILFVIMNRGWDLDENLIKEIKTEIRRGASPRHVPSKIIAVEDIPQTKNGKITEIAVRDVVMGRSIKNVEVLANPESLEQFKDLDALKVA